MEALQRMACLEVMFTDVAFVAGGVRLTQFNV